MKKIIIAALFAPLVALAQTYPSPTFNSITLQNPLTPANGGTGVANTGTITLGGNFTTSGSNPLVLNTTGATNITLPTSGTILNSSSGATAGANSNITSLSGLTTPLSVSQGGTGSTTATGSGSTVLATSPTLVTPNLGTPSSITLTNGTGLPVSGLTGLGSGVATALGTAVTGSSGGIVLGTGPTISNATLTGTPTVPTPAAGSNNTTAVNSAFVAAHAPCPSILDFGGNKSGTVDNSAAFTSAIAASPTGRVCVFFPAGKYLFSSTINYTFPNNTSSITILGAGSDVTELTFTLAGFPGIALNYLGPLNSAHVRDMTLTSQNAGGGNSGIYFNQTQTTIGNPANTALSDVTNVTFRGSDGYEVTNYFSEDVLVNSVSNINFINDMFIGPASLQGVGAQLGASSTALGVVYNFIGCTFNAHGIGIYYAQYIQGVTVANSNFTADADGIVAPSGQPGLDQLSVTGSQFNTTQNGILLQSPVSGLMIQNNFFLVQNNAVGIQLQQYSQFSIVGNTWNPAVLPRTNQTGIVIGPYSSYAGVITGNQFANLTLAINLQATSQFVNVQSNSYTGNSTNVTNSGTNNTIGGGSQ